MLNRNMDIEENPGEGFEVREKMMKKSSTVS
jgi:hypothetical protein